MINILALFKHFLGSKYLYSYTFNDGKILAKGLTARVPEKEKVKVNSDYKVKSSNYYCELWGHFTVWTDGSITLDYTYVICSCETTTAIRISSGETFIKSNCTEGGGGTPQPIPVVNIFNNLSHPCAKLVLDRVMNNANYVTNWVAETFIPGSKYAINFTQSTSFTAGYAITLPVMAGGGEVKYANVVFSDSLIGKLSQEMIAVTVLHESAHAVFVAEPERLQGMSVHGFITQNLIPYISNVMQNMYGVSPAVGNALAWSGLNKPGNPMWDALTTTQKIEIIDIMRTYSHEGTGGTRSWNCPN